MKKNQSKKELEENNIRKIIMLIILIIILLLLLRCCKEDQTIIATRKYIKDNNLVINTEEKIMIKDLISRGYLSVFDNECINDSYVIVSKDTNGQNKYELKKICKTTMLRIELLGPSEQIIRYGDQYQEYGAKAYMGDIEIYNLVKINTSNLDMTKVGEYEVIYTVTIDNNTKSIKRKVKIIDDVSPTIILNGGEVVYVNKGDLYKELGAIAKDNYDKELTNSIVIEGNVDTTKNGIYYIKYSVTDSSGNKAIITRTVMVIDGDKPTITLKGNATVYLDYPDRYKEAGYSAYDKTDGDLTGKVIVSKELLETKLGTYYIRYIVTDSNGNSVVATRTVIVRDNVKPLITLNGDEVIELNLGEEYIEQGAKALDNYSGNITAQIKVENSVDTSIVGTTYITYRVKDEAGNESFIQRKVIVRDTVAPIINYTGPTPIYHEVNTLFNPPILTATDNYDGDITNRVSLTNNVILNKIGTYELVYTVKDSSLNEATLVIQVIVRDTIKPIIKTTYDTITLELGTEYNMLDGISVTDNYDTIDNSKIVITTDPVYNENIEGTYTIKYNVKDSSGNIAEELIRTVVINRNNLGLAKIEEFKMYQNNSIISNTNIENLNPGDVIVVKAKVKNENNISIWVRSILNLAGSEGTMPNYDVFKVYPGEYRSYEEVESLTPLNLTDNKKTSSVSILNGSIGTINRQTETTGINNIEYVYTIYFDRMAGNIYQGKMLDIDFNVQSIQYRGNPTPDWSDVNETTINP